MKKIYKHTKGMIDISEKDVTKRVAVATATLSMGKKAFKLFLKAGSPKGDVFETAKVAGVMAAKSTPAILPFCHPLALSKAQVTFDIDKKNCLIRILAEISCLGRTGVEMEALTAVTVAALTIYDMMKWADKGMKISHIVLLEKIGGKSGDYRLSVKDKKNS